MAAKFDRAGEPELSQCHRFDNVPTWDGEDIKEKRVKVRMTIRLWDHDTELPKEKRGAILFRAFAGKAVRRSYTG